MAANVFIDLTGQRFGRLTALRRVPGPPHAPKLSTWECRCDCGAISIVRGQALRIGKTKSCGCLKVDVGRENGLRTRRHGHAVLETRTYRIWSGMKSRCSNATDEDHYRRYGGRGIKVCERWLTFENFLADMGEAPQGLTLERKDNDGDYELNNCEWATLIKQNNNRSNNRFLTDSNGVTHSLSDWARSAGLTWDQLNGRLRRGMTLEQALAHQSRKHFFQRKRKAA